ncbi:MAG: hypothetical protein ABSC46_09245 [Candidatus Limnocylindrales bacterium]|jgi:hypothetical protein
MTDLTDSFCERCGARYAFVANAPKGLSLKGARVLARGLKNFVFTDGQSISDAMELARNEDDHEASTRIAEAFHRTFNFCMSCRQYACERCWNETAGACLSCSPAPEAEVVATDPRLPMSRPATAEELPILRGSTSPSETEWSLFAETPAADPNQDAAPTAPYEPIVFGERRPEQPARRRDPPAWPAADRADDQQASATGSNGKNGHDSSRKPADPDAAAAWPVTDEIAPEMMLTADELEIVHTQLSQVPSKSTPAGAAAEAHAASRAPLLEERRTWWNSRAQDEDENQSADWSLEDAAAEDRPTRDLELAAAASSGAVSADASEPVGESQEEWAEGPSTRETDLPPVSPKLLRRTSTSDDLPPLTTSEPEPQTRAPGGLVARLFGRRAPETEPSPAAGPQRSSSRRGQTADEAWPHATAWSERSLEGRHWWLDTGGATAGPAPMTADGVLQPERVDAQPIVTPEPAAERSPAPRRTVPSKPRHEPAAPLSRTAPVASQASNVEIDPRSAAALRLSAVEAAMGLPASNEAEPEAEVRRDAPAAPAAPTYEPAWLRVQREAAEREPVRSIDAADGALAADSTQVPTAEEPAAAVPAAEEAAEPEQAQAQAQAQAQPEQAQAQAEQPTESQAAEMQPAPAQEAPAQTAFDMPVQPPATPWPPLGASWPAREKPGTPWPAPDSTAVPAVVAARQVPAPTMAEMWAQSAQEVLNRGSVRVCHHCALPVSTKARFCRRCGTQQV